MDSISQDMFSVWSFTLKGLIATSLASYTFVKGGISVHFHVRAFLLECWFQLQLDVFWAIYLSAFEYLDPEMFSDLIGFFSKGPGFDWVFHGETSPQHDATTTNMMPPPSCFNSGFLNHHTPSFFYNIKSPPVVITTFGPNYY